MQLVYKHRSNLTIGTAPSDNDDNTTIDNCLFEDPHDNQDEESDIEVESNNNIDPYQY